MKYIETQIEETLKGKFKAYVWGQPDAHLMDWNGCNYRHKPVPGQPLRGYKTVKDVERYIKAWWTKEKLKEFAINCGDGSFLSESINVIKVIR